MNYGQLVSCIFSISVVKLMVLLLTETLETSAISCILELSQFLCFDVRSNFRRSTVVFFVRLLIYIAEKDAPF